VQRILIVDDDPGIVAAIMPSLKAQGYDIAVAHDGDHALSLFTQLAPDLVLLDLVMPSLHGIAVLRRGRSEQTVIQCADLVIDTSRRLVQRQGQIVSLTPIEYAVLAELVTHRNGVVTARQIVQRVWGPQYIDSTDYVKGVIRRLRLKLEPDPSHPRYILTEPHVGYRFNHSE